MDEDQVVEIASGTLLTSMIITWLVGWLSALCGQEQVGSPVSDLAIYQTGWQLATILKGVNIFGCFRAIFGFC